MSVAPQTVRVVQVVPAAPERVFRAWTNPLDIREWFGRPSFQSPDVEVDLRIGGSYRIEVRGGDGLAGRIVGRYVEIDPPTRLVQTFVWEQPPWEEIDTSETLLTVELRAVGSSTEVVVTHEHPHGGAAVVFHELGWTASLVCMGELLRSEASR